MFFLGALVFGVYLALMILDEVRFHRPRSIAMLLSREEALQHLLESLALLTCIAVVYWIEYSSKTRIFYFAIAMAAAALKTRDEIFHHQNCSKKEMRLHAIQYLFYPLMLITLGAVWPFIDGVNFFLNIILPFSVKGLRSLVLLFGCGVVFLTIYQMICWFRSKTIPKQ